LELETLGIEAGVMHVEKGRCMSMSRGNSGNKWLINLDLFFMNFIINTSLEPSLKHIEPLMSSYKGKNIGNLLI